MISERLKMVILRELNIENIEISDESKASEIPGWDSLSHVRIICAVEHEYNVQIRPLEVIRLKKIGDLQVLIDKKCFQKDF